MVAEEHGIIIFVEVKTRVSRIYGLAEDAFASTKSERFRRGIEMFIKNHKISADNIRADLITVDIDRQKKMAKIKHFKDVI